MSGIPVFPVGAQRGWVDVDRVEAEVEKPAAQGAAMEITVSRQDLVKELTATQSVVERKTTIPILSNFLIEARRPVEHHRDRSRPGDPHQH
jgi:hypothetical protein